MLVLMSKMNVHDKKFEKYDILIWRLKIIFSLFRKFPLLLLEKIKFISHANLMNENLLKSNQQPKFSSYKIPEFLHIKSGNIILNYIFAGTIYQLIG